MCGSIEYQGEKVYFPNGGWARLNILYDEK